MDISRYQEAAVLCKLDYLVLCDGAAGSMCALEVKWVSGQQWKVGLHLSSSTSPCHMIWESETAQLLHLCVYGTCESQPESERVSEPGGGRTGCNQAMYSVGTNATEWWDIKVGICFFPSTKKLFIHGFL